MVKLTFMSIVKFEVDSDTQAVKILARYCNPIEGTTKEVASTPKKRSSSCSRTGSEVFLMNRNLLCHYSAVSKFQKEYFKNLLTEEHLIE